MTRCLVMIACLMGLVSVGGMAGCQQGSKATEGRTVSALLGEWTLESIEGTDRAKAAPPGMRRPSIVIDGEGQVSGFGGVNRISSALDTEAVTRGEFKLGPIISTKMAGSQVAMEMESRFTRLLGEAGTYQLAGNTLTIMSGQKGPAMKLVRGQ